MVSAMLLSLVACVQEEPASIEFKKSEYQVFVGEEMELAPELVINNSTEVPVFSSSDDAVVSIKEDGRLTALASGEVTVTAQVGNLKATCKVKVVDVKAESLTINAPKTLALDSLRSVTVSVKPQNYDKENLIWDFVASDPALEYETEKVSASEYKVRFKTFVKGGKLHIKVSDSMSDLIKEAAIEVVKDGVAAVRVDLDMPDQLTETIWATVKAVVEPENYDSSNLSWEFVPTSEELGFKYEKVSDLEYKVCFSSYVRDGSVTIMITDEISSNFAQGMIAARPLPTEGISSLSVSPEALRLRLEDEPFNLKLTTEPEDYDPLLLEWTSADEKVVTVSGGLVTIVGEGQTTVTVKDIISKKESSCLVAVVPTGEYVSIKRIDLNQTNISMRVGDADVQLIPTCYDSDGNVVENYPELEWIADPVEMENGMVDVVEVSQQGVVTAKNAGSTQITVRDKVLTNIKALCHVNVAPAPVKVKEVKLLQAAKVISAGKTFQIETVVTPEDAEDKTLKYTSSDDKVVTVDAQGLVTGIANGSAYVRATASNGVYGECEVTVADAWVEFEKPKVTLLVGEMRTLTASVMPEELGGGQMTWSSSNHSVVSVDQNGNVKGLAAGDVEIKVVTSNGIEGSCSVVVINDYNILFTLNEEITSNGVHQFESFELGVGYTNEYVPEKVEWEISDPSALKITEKEDKFVVEAIYEGMIAKNSSYPVTLTHRVGQKEKSLTINILPAVPRQIVLTAVPEVDGVPYKMMHGDTFTFEAKVLPEQASQQVELLDNVSGYVQNNTFKATALGLHNFIAYAPGHTDVRYTFSVEVLPVPLTDMTLSYSDMELQAGAQASIAVTFVPENASYQTLDWISSDESVATVDSYGVVTAVAAGQAVISATQSNNNITKVCNVTVKSAASAGPAVGDYYYSDGTTSSSLDNSKTVIGVVFSVNNPTLMGDAKLSADYSGCTHGYVVSTVEYTEQDWGSVSAQNGHGYYKGIGYDANLIVDKDKANGYGNTLAHRDLNTSRSDFAQMFNAEAGVVATHTMVVPAPDSASPWYVPSYKEMQMLNENREIVNAVLAAVGGTVMASPYEREESFDPLHKSDWYWTSTIYGSWYESGKSYDHFKYPFDLSKNGWTTSQQASGKCKVRIILAF